MLTFLVLLVSILLWVSAGPISISFVDPTPSINEEINLSYAVINTSISLDDMTYFVWNWNGTNYTFFDESTLLFMNFDNVSSIGENSDSVLDLSGNLNNGSVSGGASLVSGKYGLGYDFSSNGDIQIDSGSDELRLTEGNFTISAWIRPNSVASNYMIFGNNFEGGGYQFQIFNGPLTMRYYSSPAETISGNTVISTGVWSHVLVTYDNSSDKVYFYVNGEADGSGTPTRDISGGGNTFYIGNDGRDGAGYEFDGVIDELRVYNRFFGGEEVLQDYYSNLRRINQSHWSFLANESDLENGTYTYYISLSNSTSSYSSASRNFTVSVNGSGSGGPGGSSGDLNITFPVKYFISQRNGTYGDIPVEGVYSGNPSSIEASFNGGAWEVIDSNLSGGTFSGVLENQSQGQGELVVRFLGNVSVNNSVEQVGIGDIYAIGGQSNAEMRGYNAQDFNESLNFNATVYREDDAWRVANDPVDTGTSSGSGWPIVANYLVEEQNIPIAFISAASGGSAITQWQKGDFLYNNLVNQINEATYDTGKIKAILFFQGERDAAISGTGCNGNYTCYRNNLNSMASDFLEDTGASKVLVGQINHQPSGTRESNDNIRRAQQDGWNFDTNVSFGITTYDIDLADNLHFKTDEQLRLYGERWYALLEETFYSGVEGRGPRIEDADFDVSNNKLILDFDSDLNQSTGLEGWRILYGANIYDDSNIVNVSFPENDTIVLRLDTEIGGGSILYLGSSNDGQDKNVLRDLSRFSLPAEMIFNYSINMIYQSFQFVPPTPDDKEVVTDNQVLVNVSVEMDEFNYFKWNWDDSNYTLFDGSLQLMMGFDNRSVLGENESYFVDVSGKNRDAISEGVSFCEGTYNRGAFFDGGDYLNFSDVLDLDDKDFSFEFWLNLENNGSASIFYKTNPSFTVDSSNGYALYIDNDSYLNFKAQSYEVNAKSSEGVSSDWTHVVVVLERDAGSNNVSFYIDGEFVNKDETLGGGINITSGYDLIFGRSVTAGGQVIDDLNGTIDELKFYDRALSLGEVREHYYSIFSRDSINHWTFLSNRTGLREGVFNYSAYLKDTLEIEYSISRSFNVSFPPDSVAPSSVSGLDSVLSETWIYWMWINPSEPDFDENIIFVDGVNVLNTSNNYYNSSGHLENTTHNITIYTKDYSENVNITGVFNSTNTLPDTNAPSILSTDPSNDARLGSGLKSKRIVLETDEISVCRYGYKDSNWSEMDKMPVTNSTIHNLTVVVSAGNTYEYWFLCGDLKDNLMSSAYSLRFIVESKNDVPGGGSSGSGSDGGGSFGPYVRESPLKVEDISAIFSLGEEKIIRVGVKNDGRISANKCRFSTVEGFDKYLESNDIQNIGIGELVEFSVVLKAMDEGIKDVRLFVECLDNLTREIGTNFVLLKSDLPLLVKQVSFTEDDRLLISYVVEPEISSDETLTFRVTDSKGAVIGEVLRDVRLVGGRIFRGDVSVDISDARRGILRISVFDSDGKVIVDEDVIFGGGALGLTGFSFKDFVGSTTSYVWVIVLVFILMLFFVFKAVFVARKKSPGKRRKWGRVHKKRSG